MGSHVRSQSGAHPTPSWRQRECALESDQAQECDYYALYACLMSHSWGRSLRTYSDAHALPRYSWCSPSCFGPHMDCRGFRKIALQWYWLLGQSKGFRYPSEPNWDDLWYLDLYMNVDNLRGGLGTTSCAECLPGTFYKSGCPSRNVNALNCWVWVGVWDCSSGKCLERKNRGATAWLTAKREALNTN